MQTNSIKMQLRLSDGLPVTLRRWRQEDERRMPETLRQMVSPIGYVNYFAPASPVWNEDQDVWAQIEEQHRRAWVALDPAQSTQPLLAMGRVIRVEDKPWLGTMAVGVQKPYQHRGLGRIVTAMLYFMAQSEDIRNLRVLVPAENELVIGWLKRLGASSKLFADEIAELDLPICHESNVLPANESCRHFRSVLDEIAERCCVTV